MLARASNIAVPCPLAQALDSRKVSLALKTPPSKAGVVSEGDEMQWQEESATAGMSSQGSPLGSYARLSSGPGTSASQCRRSRSSMGPQAGKSESGAESLDEGDVRQG